MISINQRSRKKLMAFSIFRANIALRAKQVKFICKTNMLQMETFGPKLKFEDEADALPIVAKRERRSNTWLIRLF